MPWSWRDWPLKNRSVIPATDHRALDQYVSAASVALAKEKHRPNEAAAGNAADRCGKRGLDKSEILMSGFLVNDHDLACIRRVAVVVPAWHPSATVHPRSSSNAFLDGSRRPTLCRSRSGNSYSQPTDCLEFVGVRCCPRCAAPARPDDRNPHPCLWDCRLAPTAYRRGA
jgi:hypothetical protein